MTDDQNKILDALLRNDLVAFTEKCCATLSPATELLRNWHHSALAHRLGQCMRGEIRRLIITLAPRSLKSIFCSVAFPAFVLGHQPSRKIVCVSYSADLAGEHARASRDVMESEWYRRAFPGTRISRRRFAELDFTTTKHGGRLSTSPGGSLTGRGGSLIIIDDPIKADDALSDLRRAQIIQWFKETLITRLDDKRNDVIILVMQRLHVDDLAGFLLETGEWTHLNLPAVAQADEIIAIGPELNHVRAKGELLHPEREGAEELAALERTLGWRAYSAQYLQEPVAPDGTLLHLSWFKRYEEAPERQPKDELVQSWDTANKTGLTNDYSVCTTWLIRDKTYYLLDVLRMRLDFPSLKRKVIEHAAEWRADRLLIEDAASGQSLLQELRQRPPGATWWLEAYKSSVDKIQRAEAQGVVIEEGRVILPRAAPWLEAFMAEIRNFPRGSHDDQVDSMTQFLAWVRARVKYVTSIDTHWQYAGSPKWSR